jgi:cardiolipin synthase
MDDLHPGIFYTVWPYLFAVLNMGLAIVASCHVVLTKRDHRSALGWVGVIWLTPILGAFLYVMFGVNRIHRKARRLMKYQQKPALPPREYSTDEDLHRELGSDYDRLSRLVQFVDKTSRVPLLDGNRLTPLAKGDDAYAEMLSAIEAAIQSVSLQPYF